MIIKSFKLYTPEKSDVPGAMYLKSVDGRDWYESQSLFAADTLKLVYDSNGIITSISKDVSMLWPVNQSVAEVADTEENRKADISGRWGFDGEKITDLLTAEKARGMKGDEINAWRNEMEAANYTFEHNGRKWDYGKSTQTRLEPSVAAAKAGKLPEAFFWTDA
ncbi:TPA: phage tail protein, partial [Escherichia coli]|nr:phage tail protein [Escherichia coli]